MQGNVARAGRDEVGDEMRKSVYGRLEKNISSDKLCLTVPTAAKMALYSIHFLHSDPTHYRSGEEDICRQFKPSNMHQSRMDDT